MSETITFEVPKKGPPQRNVFLLPPELTFRIKAAAMKSGESGSEIVRRIIGAHFEREASKQ